MNDPKTITFENKVYQLIGKQWIDTQTYQVPPMNIVQYLNAQLIKEAEDDNANLPPNELYKKAMTIRDTSPSTAVKMLKQVLEKWPDHIEIIAALAASYRKCHQPQEALNVTENYRDERSTMIHTVRAAALCDLEKWDQAKKEVANALRIEKSPEAFGVVTRIKKHRPELYEK